MTNLQHNYLLGYFEMFYSSRKGGWYSGKQAFSNRGRYEDKRNGVLVSKYNRSPFASEHR